MIYIYLTLVGLDLTPIRFRLTGHKLYISTLMPPAPPPSPFLCQIYIYHLWLMIYIYLTLVGPDLTAMGFSLTGQTLHFSADPSSATIQSLSLSDFYVYFIMIYIYLTLLGLDLTPIRFRLTGHNIYISSDPPCATSPQSLSLSDL